MRRFAMHLGWRYNVRIMDGGKGEMKFLKWGDSVVGRIDGGGVVFDEPAYNTTVRIYTRGRSAWTRSEFTDFLAERIVSRDRRDIERILFRCGLSQYDVMRVAAVTRGMHPKDLLWLARSADERYDDAMTEVFSSVFQKRTDLIGESVDSPEGYNIKRYGVYNGKYGIYKQRISPVVTDVESEIAACLFARRMGVPCCPVFRTDNDTVFSEFLYDFSREYIVHFRRLFDGGRSENEYQNLLSVRPQYKDDFIRMLVLDFVTRQDDRHLSNIAVKVSGSEEFFYPLFDNGRSLFYEDTTELVSKAVCDLERYATAFGPSGSYLDHLRAIAADTDIPALVRLDIAPDEIDAILSESGFTGYRRQGAAEWVARALDLIRGM
jgi:hypothetical protein